MNDMVDDFTPEYGDRLRDGFALVSLMDNQFEDGTAARDLPVEHLDIEYYQIMTMGKRGGWKSVKPDPGVL